MNTFPKEINIKDNKDIYNDIEFSKKFEKMNYDRIIKELRNDIHILIISRIDENNYFDIDTFGRSHNYKNKNLEKMISDIRNELENLGWKTKLSFGNTGLFIYSTEKEPSSCW
jgi:hypothetical protein